VPRILNISQQEGASKTKKITENILKTKSTITGQVQITLTQELNKDFVEAENQMKKMGDGYLTTEHLLLAMWSNNSSYIQDISTQS
jgi:ATP-dependent Clp protease ATP-binding subunit ClpB